MSTTTISALAEEMTTHLKAAKAIADRAEADGDRDFSDDERGEVNTLMEKAGAAKKRLDQAKADDVTRKALRDLGDGIGLDDSGDAAERGRKAERSGLYVPGQGRKSVGQHFTESAQYKALLGQQGPGGFSKESRVRTDPVGYKALVTGASPTSAGAFVQPDDLGIQGGPELFYRPLTLRQLITNGSTESDQIEYARITGWTRAAAPVPEATSAALLGDGTGGTATLVTGGYKPQSGFTTARVSTGVKTVAVWMPATKRSLSDASQVRTLIDNFLEQDLEQEIEDQVIAGDGTGENFEGIAAVSGTQAQAAVADPAGRPAGFGRLLALRRAKTKVRLGGRSVANGYVINPADLETLDEIATGQDVFYFGGPSGANGTSPLWNLPVIESEAVPQGTAWCADWRKAIIWDREQASIVATDTHSDFFIRNLVAILAEMRAGFGVIQPSAFVSVDLS